MTSLAGLDHLEWRYDNHQAGRSDRGASGPMYLVLHECYAPQLTVLVLMMCRHQYPTLYASHELSGETGMDLALGKLPQVKSEPGGCEKNAFSALTGHLALANHPKVDP